MFFKFARLAEAAKALIRKKPVQKIRRIQKRLTTEEAHQRQRERHIEVQDTVQRILPRGLAREWNYVYRAIDEEKTFGAMVDYLQVIALNEGDGNGWDDIYDAAMADDRFTDGDKNVLTEMVLDLQYRAMFPEKTDAVIKGLVAGRIIVTPAGSF